MNVNIKEIRSAKRGKNERSGVHKWHPYYAGYSEVFVEDMLEYLGADANSIVLDPWMGSGTTALVCQKLGITSLGNEINPVMVLFSRAKTAKLLDFDMEGYTNRIIEDVRNMQVTQPDNSVEVIEFIEMDNFLRLTKLRRSVDAFCTGIELSENVKAFFYAVLFKCLRSLGNFKNGRNPTWVVKETPTETKEENVNGLFRETALSMINDLDVTFKDIFIHDRTVPEIVEGDSRKLQFGSESVDFVVTSPPYLTRIDYAVSTKPELLFLGYEEDTGFDSIRRSTMGAPVISDKSITYNNEWGETCTSFLKEVENHHTKAARSYYLPVYLQYFRDAIESLYEIKRVLKSGGQACLVVQSSYFKEVEGKLGEMYVEMGRNLGFEAYIAKREEIKQHIAHVNTKSSLYVKNKVYYEDAVIFRKR
ncbi:DNA methylase [compost metagenome]